MTPEEAKALLQTAKTQKIMKEFKSVTVEGSKTTKMEYRGTVFDIPSNDPMRIRIDAFDGYTYYFDIRGMEPGAEGMYNVMSEILQCIRNEVWIADHVVMVQKEQGWDYWYDKE